VGVLASDLTQCHRASRVAAALRLRVVAELCGAQRASLTRWWTRAGRGERAVATLKTWKILTKLRCSPSRTTAMVQAILVLHHVDNPTYQG
jgi:hypothetical protein